MRSKLSPAGEALLRRAYGDQRVDANRAAIAAEEETVRLAWMRAMASTTTEEDARE